MGGGTDDFGFSALPGSYRQNIDGSNGSVVDVGRFGYWFTATEYDDRYAYDFGMSYGVSSMRESNAGKDHGLSVRCIQDVRQ